MNVVDFRTNKNHENVAFLKILPLLNCHKINTRTNLKNPYHKFQDLKAKMCFTSRKLFWGKTDFTAAYLKILQNQNIFVIGSSLDMKKLSKAN